MYTVTKENGIYSVKGNAGELLEIENGNIIYSNCGNTDTIEQMFVAYLSQ